MRIGVPLALGVLAVAASVRADELVACASHEAVFVERISGDQVEVVYQEPALNRFTDQPGALSWGWSDARTLWVLRKQGATRNPANAVDSEPTLPSVPAPPGYSAALRTVKARGFTFRGAECKGPSGQWQSGVLDEVWPPVNANFHDRSSLAELAEVRVVKADWVRTAPPVARFVSSKRGLTWVSYVEDCTDERPAPVLLQGGRWIDRELVRRADGSEIGSLQGSQRIMVAPRP